MDKKLQKGIVAVLIANLVNVAFSLATNFLLPKYLSIESYAGIKEFQLYVSYVGLFHLGFVDGIYLKYGGKTLGKDVDKEFSTDLSTMCIFQTVTTIAVLIVAIILRDRILAFFAISILPQNMSNYFKFLYQATGEFNLYGKAMNLTTISTFALNMVLLFVFRTDSVFWYIAGYVVLYFLIWIVLDVYFRKNHTLQKGALFSFKSFLSNIKAGFLLTLLYSGIFVCLNNVFLQLNIYTDDAAFLKEQSIEPTYKILSTQYTLKVESRGWKMPDRVCQRGVH